MFEFLYSSIVNQSAQAIHDNMIFLSAKINKEIEQCKKNNENDLTETFQKIYNYISSSVNVAINMYDFNSEEFDEQQLLNLINNCKQLNLPLNLYAVGGTNFNNNSESSEMLFSKETLDKLSTINEILIKNNLSPLKFMEDNHSPESVWTIEQVKKANNDIDSVVKFIKESNFSPFEAMAFIHKVVTSTFKFQDDSDRSIMARSIVGLTNSDKIVCVGYSKFVKAVINKLNSSDLVCETLVSTLRTNKVNDEVFNELGLVTYSTGHMQNLIKINDKKYKIKGVYISDACYDAKTDNFPSGKGYGNFMFPVSDLLNYNDISFYQPKDTLDTLLSLCSIDSTQIDEKQIPVIKENIRNSKPIPLSKLQSCIKAVYSVLFPTSSEQEIDRLVNKTLNVSKMVSKQIFNHNAKNAIAIEAHSDTLQLD